jgi:lysophospholipase L1-like esterase
VAGNEVTFIGDSWVELPGSQVSHLEELAQEAGALEQGGRYDDRSKSGNTMAQIVQQYRANRNTKVLIMDGGGIDLIQSNNQQTATNMANAFTDFLAEVASDGNVQHIIYYLYPDIPGLAQVNFQLLEPGNRAACEASTVPCFFLPLKPIWNNSLMGGDNIHPSVQGGELIAEEVWKIMQENCIAQ